MVVRALVLLLAFAVPASAEKVTRETFQSGGKSRTYSLFVPDSVKADVDAPLLILLHGSGGRDLVEFWRDTAKKEGVILVGPHSTDKTMWELRNDGPYFIADLVDAVRSTRKIDLRRLYLFGHSAGAIQGLMLGLLESEYFAAVAVHAGALPQTSFDLIDMADRKIPLGIWVGTNDNLFPMSAVEATKNAMDAKGLSVHLRPIQNHTHNYYQRSGEVNAEAWAFLSKHRLSADPKFKEYDLK